MCKILVGTYTTGTNSQGIYEITLDQVNGGLSGLRLAASAADPSYLAISNNGCNLYSTSENAGYMSTGQGGVMGFVCNENVWKKDFESLSGGSLPCHVAINKGENLLAVSNYQNGMIRLFSLSEKGVIKKIYRDLPGRGKGLNPDRQECSHAHQCTFINDIRNPGCSSAEELWCCDLGTDRIRRYLPEGENKEIQELKPILFPAGSGPRHLVINQKAERAYLVTELSNEIYILHKEDNEWLIESRHLCLPSGTANMECYAAAIRLDDSGRKLFVSNRGHDSVSVFSLSDDGSVVSRESTVKCGGLWPRDILPIGGFLLCACQNSNEVTCLRSEADGSYKVCSRISVPSPACLIRKSDEPSP